MLPVLIYPIIYARKKKMFGIGNSGPRFLNTS